MLSRASRRFVALKLPSSRGFLFDVYPQPRQPIMQLRPKNLPITYKPTQIRTSMFSQRVRRTYRSAARDIWRKNPIFFPFALISIIAAGALSTYIVSVFYVRATQVDEKVNRFPPPVAKELRRALYFTEINLEPQKALEHYRVALQIAMDMDMHPWSDEVLGIKLQMADMLIKAGYHQKAAEFLGRLAQQGFEWVLKTRDRYILTLPKGKAVIDPNLKEIVQPDEETKNYELALADRTLKKIIGTFLLLGELYEDEHIKDPAKAFSTRRAALGMLTEEIENRRRRGLPPLATPEEGDNWMTAEEVGHVMSDVGETWLRAGRPDKALELLMPSIAILRDVEGKDVSCRQVILLANIAAAMFDHNPTQQEESATGKKKQPVISVEQQMESSRAWALKSIEVSKLVQEDLRDESCDMGCAAAADVLSAIAEWQGADEEARKWLREEKRYCESANYAEGVEKAVKMMAQVDRISKQRQQQQAKVQ
jgi:tetratricopeptide (TPR) repeat protein